MMPVVEKYASLHLELQEFLAQIEFEKVLQSFSSRDRTEAVSTFEIFKNEAPIALSLIDDSLTGELRILEVGAGLCLLSLFLKSKGFDVVACEPASNGFDFFARLKDAILQYFTWIDLPVLTKNVQELRPETEGTFDLIFSSNVVEHIPELEAAFLAMKALMNPEARMTHGCPNYLVPYEPHFGIPVLIAFPQISKVVFRNRIKDKMDVWNSLNFISYLRVKKIAKVMNMPVLFEPHLTYNTIMRLSHDESFAKRHSGTFISRFFIVLSRLHLLSLIRYLPPWCSTPMIFTMFKCETRAPRSDD